MQNPPPPNAATVPPLPRFRVTRIGAGHEGDLVAELEAAELAGYEFDAAPLVLANGDLLVISRRDPERDRVTGPTGVDRRIGLRTRRLAPVAVASERRVGPRDRRTGAGF